MPKETPGVSFPLDETGKNAGYDLADLKETVKFNIKNIVMTSPGERIMNPDFGVGIREVLFLNLNNDLIQQIGTRIRDQITEYAPYLSIKAIIIKPIGPQSLKISISYSIDFADIADVFEIELSNNLI